MKNDCAQCILTEKDTSIFTIESNGKCNYCNSFENYSRFLGTIEQKTTWLDAKIEKIKKIGKRQKYDCIIGISGGKDSAYLAYWAKQNGLKPLLIHLDNGWNSEKAVQNIEQICRRLNFDYKTIVIDWECFKNLQVAYLKAGVVDMEVLTDHAIYASLLKLARKNNIKYILSGFNYQTEIIMPKDWTFNKLDWNNIKDICTQQGEAKSLKLYPHISFYKRIYYSAFYKLKTIQVLNYIDYNVADIERILKEELGWEDLGGKHYESFFTKFYQAYILPNKFGIDKRVAHLSNLICSKQITKQEALRLLEEPLYNEVDIKNEKNFVLKKLGLTEEEFNKIMAGPIQKHEFFKTEKKMWDTYFKIINVLKFRKV